MEDGPPHKLPEMQRPRRGEGAARRARPKPAPGALLAHHPAAPAGVVGRIGGPPPGGAAPPPHLGLARMGATKAVGAGSYKISVLYAGMGYAPPGRNAPDSTPRPVRGTALQALLIAGWPGCAPGTGRTGPPAIIQNSDFVSGTGPSPGQRLNLWRRRSPGWRSCWPSGSASGASLALGRGTGGSGELTWRSAQLHPPEWRAASAAHRPAALARAGRRSGPIRARPEPEPGLWGRGGGAARRARPEPAAPGSPLRGAGGGAQAGILDNRTVCHQGHLGSGSTHKGGLRYAPGIAARSGPV